jgi:transposase
MRTEKQKRIIALKKEGKTVREIAEITKSSFATITSTVNDAEDEERIIANGRTRLEEKKQSDEKYKWALQMFVQGNKNVEVATSIGLRADEVILYRKEYWRLVEADKLVTLYDRIEPNISTFVKVAEMIKQEGISDDETRRILRLFKDLMILDDKIYQAKAQLDHLYGDIVEAQKGLQSFKQEETRLKEVIERLRNKESEYTNNYRSDKEFQALRGG